MNICQNFFENLLFENTSKKHSHSYCSMWQYNNTLQIYKKISIVPSTISHNKNGLVDALPTKKAEINKPLQKTPRKPFFSDRNHCFKRGTRLIYAQVHITNMLNISIPSNEYAEKNKVLIISGLRRSLVTNVCQKPKLKKFLRKKLTLYIYL